LRLCLESLEGRCLLSFSPAVNYPVGVNPMTVVAADFNGDGRLDLATANSGISVMLGNADGTFQAAQNSAGYGQSLAVGDFNADGKLDLATADGNNVNVLLGNGNGTFQAPTSINIGSSSQSVAVGDFNADGKLDLGVTSNVYYPGNPDPYDWQPSYYLSRANVLLGNGDGSFSAPNTTELGYGYDVSATLADFNGDGHLDFATANDSGSVIVLLGTGTGALGTPNYFNTAYNAYSLAAGDVNGDGKLDLVTANEGSGNVSVLLGTGAGSFGAANYFVAGAGTASVALADFNGDGMTDIVAANSGDNTVSVLLGTSIGTFQARASVATGACPIAVASGDFNGDGRMDAATANCFSSNVSVLLNDGTWPALGASINIGGFPLAPVAGEADTITVTATLDYVGTVHLTSSDQEAVLPADYTFTAADHGTHTFTVILKTAGAQSITVSDTTTPSLTAVQNNIIVNPAAASRFQVSGFPSPVAAGDCGAISITSLDAYGNLATAYATVHFTSSDASAILPDDYSFSAYGYAPGVILQTVGTQSITVTDVAAPGVSGTEAGICVNPSVMIDGPYVGLRNQALTFTLSAGALPAGAMFTYKIDWNGDGVVDQTVTGPSGATVAHTYAAADTYNVGVTATVQIGTQVYTSALATRSVFISGVTVTIQTDPGDATGKALVVQGTADADDLYLGQGIGNTIDLFVNNYEGAPAESFSVPGGAAFGHVIVYGNGGDDSVLLFRNLAVPALLFGGDGNDGLIVDGSVLTNNVLVGAAGNDWLEGGSGRDLLIGGLGADTLIRASYGGSIMIGGTTDYDANLPALVAIMKEWGRTDANYTTRLKHLQGTQTGGLNGSYRLTAATVHDDAAVDNMSGWDGMDWFFVGGSGKKRDKVNAQTSGEVITNIS
jgi:hypothetical protein